jgi:hypothetical protein
VLVVVEEWVSLRNGGQPGIGGILTQEKGGRSSAKVQEMQDPIVLARDVDLHLWIELAGAKGDGEQ